MRTARTDFTRQEIEHILVVLRNAQRDGNYWGNHQRHNKRHGRIIQLLEQSSYAVTRVAGQDPHAVALGRKGGRQTSPAKAAAARENGKKGGAPKKGATVPAVATPVEPATSDQSRKKLKRKGLQDE